MSRAQMKRDQTAIMHVLRYMGGSATIADIYLRAGEGLGAAIRDLCERGVVEAFRLDHRGSLRILS